MNKIFIFGVKAIILNHPCIRMNFHEVPYDLEALTDLTIVEGVVMAIIGLAVHHLIAPVTPGPHDTAPPVHPVHVGGVHTGLGLAVHGGGHLEQVVHLDVVVVAVPGLRGHVGPRAIVVRRVRRDRDCGVQEAVEVNDADWRVWHRIVSPERGAANSS